MQSIENLNSHLKHLVNFLTPLLPLINSHLVQYFNQNQWDNLLTPRIRADLLQLQCTDLNSIPMANLYNASAELLSSYEYNTASLKAFLGKVKSLHDGNTSIETPLSKLQNFVLDVDKLKYLERGMKTKKAHEVSYMSQFVANACKERKLSWVMDIGSGLGYLSSVFLSQHGLKVVAVDSSTSQIASTLKRTKITQSLLSQSSKTERLTKREQREKAKLRKESPQLNNIKKGVIEERDTFTFFNAYDGKFIGITKFLTEQDNISEILKSNFPDGAYPPSNLAIVGLHTCGNLAPTSIKLFVSNPIVQFLCNVGCCYHLLEEEFTEDQFYIKKHTVGKNQYAGYEEKKHAEGKKQDAGYAKLPKNANNGDFDFLPRNDRRYHCLELDPVHQKRIGKASLGFPLCSYLRKTQFSLGRNARNLASHSTQKITLKSKGLKPFFWRALLQVMVIDIHGFWPENCLVGRKLSTDATNFEDYCRKGFNNIGLHYNLTKDQIYEYLDKYESREEEFLRFYFLKSSLSPLVENLINLDRLIYLKEQGYQNSHIVRLFEKKISARNTAIVSFK